MKVVVPDFYRDFRCLAGACHDTCCAGWEVDVDPKTAARYASVPGPFGKRLCGSISDGRFLLDASERCPFLDGNNLCEIYRNLGEEFLSDICRAHPRFVEVFGDVKELGLGLCCEESARLLLASSDPFRLVEFFDDEESETLDRESQCIRDSMFEFRAEILYRLSDRKIPLSARISEMLCFAATSESENVFFPETPAKDLWISIWDFLSGLESLGEAWNKALSRVRTAPARFGTDRIFSETDGERIVAYQIFRYLGKSLYDGDALSKVKFASLFWLILQRFGGNLASGSSGVSPKVEALKLLSRQLEYSEENMERLSLAFAGKPFLSTGAFLVITQELG